jgi:hypothetical protein
MRTIVSFFHTITNVAVIIYALWIMFFATELEFSFLRLLLSFVAGGFLIQVLPFGQALVPVLWERWWLGVTFSEVSSLAWALAIAAATAEALLFIYIGRNTEQREA